MTVRRNGDDRTVSRREFLRDAGRLAVAGGAAVAGVARAEPASTQTATRPGTQPAAGTSTVVQVRSDDIVRENEIRTDVVEEMLARAVCRLTAKLRVRDAWHSIFRDDDVIGIKFNGTGSRELGTSPLFGRVLVRSLTGAGWKPQQIVLIEAPAILPQQLGTTPASTGWSKTPFDFGSGRDHFAAVLDQVTALLNVPFLKSHNIAGMTGCLKNLSHGLIRSPARFHANRCSPFIADIVAADPLRSKVRLHLVNALRAVFDKGPMASLQTMWPAGTILASFDPVATDAVGVEMINVQRAAHGLLPLDGPDHPVPALRDAQRRGLGTCSWDAIRLVKVRL